MLNFELELSRAVKHFWQVRGKEPNPELNIKNFAISLHARAAAFAHMGEELKVLEGNNEN